MISTSVYSEVVKLREGGCTLSEIADNTGISITTAWNILKRVGCPVNKKPLLSNKNALAATKMRLSGKTIREISEELAVPQSRVYRYLEQNNITKVSKNNTHTKIKGLRDGGKTFQEIGDSLGLTRQRVHQIYSGIVSQLDLSLKSNVESNIEFYEILLDCVNGIKDRQPDLATICDREATTLKGVLKDLKSSC